MQYRILGRHVHKDPPENGCSAPIGKGKIIFKIPNGLNKCKKCFDCIEEFKPEIFNLK